MTEDIRTVLELLDPKARETLLRVLIHDHADRDAVSSRLMRYRDQNGDDWADIIDMLTLHPEEPRKVVGCSERSRPPSNVRRAGQAGERRGKYSPRCSRPPVTLGPPHLQATELYGKETGKAFVSA